MNPMTLFILKHSFLKPQKVIINVIKYNYYYLIIKVISYNEKG